MSHEGENGNILEDLAPHKPDYNIIDRYCKLVSDYTDVPDLFIKASIYHIISSLLGSRVKNIDLKGDKNRPNVWFFLSSIPGRTRRSTIINIATKHVIERALRKYYELNGKTGEDIDHIIEYTKIEEATPEGIADHLEEAHGKGIKDFRIESAEYGIAISDMSKRDYKHGMLSVLSKLYYGEGGKTSLSNRGGKKGSRIIPEGLYVTMLAGMQEAWRYIPESYVTQGTLRRIIIIHIEAGKHTKWKPPFNDNQTENKKFYDGLHKIGEDLAHMMVELDNKANCVDNYDRKYIPILAANNNKYIEFAKEVETKVDSAPTKTNLYLQTFWEHLIKLAELEALSRFDIKGENEAEYNICIHDTDHDRAKAFLDEVMKTASNVIEKIGTESNQPNTSEKDLTYMLEIISNAPHKMLTLETWLNKTRYGRNKFFELLNTLVTSGKVESISGKEELMKLGEETLKDLKIDLDSLKGRAPTVYKLLQV